MNWTFFFFDFSWNFVCTFWIWFAWVIRWAHLWCILIRLPFNQKLCRSHFRPKTCDDSEVNRFRSWNTLHVDVATIRNVECVSPIHFILSRTWFVMSQISMNWTRHSTLICTHLLYYLIVKSIWNFSHFICRMHIFLLFRHTCSAHPIATHTHTAHK